MHADWGGIRQRGPEACTRQVTARGSWPGQARALFLHRTTTRTMASTQQPKGRDGVLTALDLLIQALNIAKDACGIPPAQVAFGSASVLLTMIRVCFSLLPEDEFVAHVV